MGKETVVRPKELVASTQHFVLNLINSKYMHDYELLNLDMLNNAVVALKQFDAVYYEVSHHYIAEGFSVTCKKCYIFYRLQFT